MTSPPGQRRKPRRASTTTPSIEGEPAPRLPHERDESSDSQQSGPRDVIQQAHDDVERGLVDTDRGPPLDETYQRTREAADAEHPPGEAGAGAPAASDHAAAPKTDPPKR